jgi:hypothetical protein
MTLLSKIGSIFLKISQIAVGIGPFIPAAQKDVYKTVSNDIEQISNIIIQTELFGQALALRGSQKLIAATPAVAQIILQSSLLVDRKITDPALFKNGCTKIADGMADIMNSLNPSVDVVDKA